ncbi:hypothetical protein M0R72_09625 [Candidatus Pacearchaeota archaeon]|jgi:hypothetical protein|nr:hypothetical protein [Candidatus Pacearchaeota archaeon]
MNGLEKELEKIPTLKEKAKNEFDVLDYTYDCSRCVEKVTGVGGTPCEGCPGASDYPT